MSSMYGPKSGAASPAQPGTATPRQPRTSSMFGAATDVVPDAPETPVPAPPQNDSGVDPLWATLGVGAATAAALAFRNPALAKTIGRGAMDARRISLLSGLAPVKSLLGNVGGAVMGSIERGSLDPLKQMLSPATAREAIAVFKRGHNPLTSGPATGVSKYNLPARFMGAMDEAGQNALQRAGYTSDEAAREMLQAPLPREVGKAFDNPVADYLVPFRKTPLNALLEGMKVLGPKTKGQAAALGTSLATGAASGYMADDPKTVALTTAAHGRYGLPHAMAAGATYALKSGSNKKGTEIIDAVADFGGMGQGVVGPVVDPTRVIPKPALFNAIKYLKSLFGIEEEE